MAIPLPEVEILGGGNSIWHWHATSSAKLRIQPTQMPAGYVFNRIIDIKAACFYKRSEFTKQNTH